MDAQALIDAIDTAIHACATALLNGEAVVEYELNGRRVRRTDPGQAIDQLTRSRARLKEIASSETRIATGIFGLGRFSRG